MKWSVVVAIVVLSLSVLSGVFESFLDKRQWLLYRRIHTSDLVSNHNVEFFSSRRQRANSHECPVLCGCLR